MCVNSYCVLRPPNFSGVGNCPAPATLCPGWEDPPHGCVPQELGAPSQSRASPQGPESHSSDSLPRHPPPPRLGTDEPLARLLLACGWPVGCGAVPLGLQCGGMRSRCVPSGGSRGRGLAAAQLGTGAPPLSVSRELNPARGPPGEACSSRGFASSSAELLPSPAAAGAPPRVLPGPPPPPHPPAWPSGDLQRRTFGIRFTPR